MPEMEIDQNKKDKEQKLLTVELMADGYTGTDIFSGIIDADYAENWRNLYTRVEQIDRMIGSDASISAILDTLKNPLLSAKYFIVCEDEALKDFAEKALFEELDGGFKNFLQEAYTMFDYGFSLFEEVYKIVNGKIYWKQFAPRLQKSIRSWDIDNKPWVDGHPAGVTQYKQSTDETESTDLANQTTFEIPWDKLLLFTHKRKGNNFEGISVLRPCNSHWTLKNLLYKISGIAADRHGVGTPYMKIKKGVTLNPAQKLEYKKLLKNIRSNEEGFALIGPEIEEFDILTSKASKGDMMDLIKHHDKKIYDSILAGFINFGEGGGGSHALSKDLSSFFLRNEQYQAEYVVERINEKLKKLVIMNFGEQEVYPKLSVSNIADTDLELFVNSMSEAKEKGLIEWQESDQAKVRETLKLEKADPDTVIEGKVVDDDIDEKKDSKKKDKKSLADQVKKKPLARERTFLRNIRDYENYLSSEYGNAENMVSLTEARIRRKASALYKNAETEIVQGVKTIKVSAKNNKIMRKMLAMIDDEANKLDKKLVNSPYQRRIFDNTLKKSRSALKENAKMLGELAMTEKTMRAFISGYISNVRAFLFNDPRRMKENVVENFGVGVGIALAISQAEQFSFNRSTVQQSIVAHPRGFYNSVVVDESMDDGFTKFKVEVPPQRLKDVSQHGETSKWLWRIVTPAEINASMSKKSDGKNASVTNGLGLHHNSFIYFYPILLENEDEEQEISRSQRQQFQDSFE